MNTGLLILAFLIGLGMGYLWGHAVKVRDAPKATPMRVSSARKPARKAPTRKKAKKKTAKKKTRRR